MSTQNAADREFVAQQNKFRGLVAEFNSRTFVESRDKPKSARFRTNLRDVLLGARAALQPDQFDPYLEWVGRQVDTQILELTNIPVAYDELDGITPHDRLPLEREMQWISARIRAEAPKLRSFRDAATEIEVHVFRGEYEPAIAKLEVIEKVLGSSMWSVQLRIALEHCQGGLERQKNYAAQLRAVHRRGLLGFVAYHTSVRNEDKTTIFKFIEDVKVRIERNKFYVPATQLYLRYRLAGEWPQSERYLSDVLRIEQNHSIVDLYETFIGALQQIAKAEEFASIRPLAVECIGKILGVEDFRLKKLLLSLGAKPTSRSLPDRDTSVSDALFSGLVRRSALLGRRFASAAPSVDAWHVIYCGLAFAHSTRARKSIPNKPTDVARLIGAIEARAELSDEAYLTLLKLVTNLNGLPSARALSDFLSFVKRDRPDRPWNPAIIGLNCPTIGMEDGSPALPVAARPGTAPTDVHGATADAWSQFISPGPCGGDTTRNAAFQLLQAGGCLQFGQYENAIHALERMRVEANPEPIRNIAADLLLHAYSALDQRADVVELLADQGTRQLTNPFFLPVVATLQKYTWTDYKAIPNVLAAPLALNLLWSSTEEEITGSLLRFAAGEALRKCGNIRPSALFDVSSRFSTHQLVYFFRFVCVPKVLDSCRVLKGTRQVSEERRAICAGLRQLDPRNAALYVDESIAITNQLALAEGQYIVDRTRIHVDPDALQSWATKEMAEDFARYADLRDVHVQNAQNFDDVLNELQSATPETIKVLAPQNEADAVLYGILGRLADEFLGNPSFGLDFYLSKRVRHQSFIGFIRGALEQAQLITTRASGGGEYHRNEHWINHFTYSSTEIKNEIDAALAKHAAAFDEMLIEAKDKRFHIRSPAYPDGLLFLRPLLHLAIARAVARFDSTLADLVQTAVAIFWADLEICLSQVRKFILEDLKPKVAQGFDELRARVKRVAEQEPGFLSFAAQVNMCSTETQRALDEASKWFTHADLEANKRYFTLKQAAEVGLEAALKCQRAFEPDIELDAPSELGITPTSLVFVHDFLFIALDNVRAHSHMKKPRTKIQVSADAQDGTITMDVLSEARPQNRKASEATISEIRGVIDNWTVGQRTKDEGNSGIIKLAAVTRQSAKGKLEFGFVGERHFRLAVTYSFILPSAEPGDDSRAA